MAILEASPPSSTTFRKKAHDPAADDDEWIPKRKIKKRAEKWQPKPPLVMVSEVFNNVSIVAKILDFMVEKKQPILNYLKLRRINRAFDSALLHKLRISYRHVQIFSSPVDQNKNQMVEINGTMMTLKNVPCFFKLLRNWRPKIEAIEFAGFLEDNKLVHDCVLRELLMFGALNIRSFRGADEICETGCEMCYQFASQSTVYGPMQWITLQNGFQNRRHFQHLLITEILLTQIALHCLEQVISAEMAIKNLKQTIGENVTCDLLEIVVSDRMMFTTETPSHPRDVIDAIIQQWRPKSVKIKFMTAYSSCDTDQWTSKHVFEELKFDAPHVKMLKMAHSERLQSLEIDLAEGDSVAESLISKPFINEYASLQRVCSNVKRVFQSDLVYITMPLEVHDLAREQFGEFCERLMILVWDDAYISRNAQYFVRIYCFGLTMEQIVKEIQDSYQFKSREIVTIIDPIDAKMHRRFKSWLPDECMANFSQMAYISFCDASNKSQMFLEVCVERNDGKKKRKKRK